MSTPTTTTTPPVDPDTLTRTLQAISDTARTDPQFAAYLIDMARLMQLIPDPTSPARLHVLPDPAPNSKS